MNSEIRASIHGHSPFSDGLSPIHRLCEAASNRGFHYFGISDHDSTGGIPQLLSKLRQINENKRCVTILPVQAVEIRAVEGDVIVAIPSDIAQPNFYRWVENICSKSQRPSLEDTIKTAVRDFNALVILPHAAESLLHSVTLDTIDYLVNCLGADVLKHVGLEVHNGACTLAYGRTIKRELQIDLFADKYNLAKFGGADFHHVSQIGSQYTIFPPGELSPEHFYNSVYNREIKPADPKFPSPLSWLYQAMIFALSTAKDRLQIRSN